MRPKKTQHSASDDLFRSRPDQIINMDHEMGPLGLPKMPAQIASLAHPQSRFPAKSITSSARKIAPHQGHRRSSRPTVKP